MPFRSDATEGVWSPTQNVAVQTEANVVAIFFFHQCGFYDPTHHIRGCQKIIWNFALKGRALGEVCAVWFRPCIAGQHNRSSTPIGVDDCPYARAR